MTGEDLTIVAHDGVRLAATVVRPASRSWPAVLIRTPYGRRALRGEAAGWARHGFGCLVVDVRGRGDSEGTFRPYTGEAQDGRAALEHLRVLPGCDGRVLLAGASYGAHCAVATAIAEPDVVGVLAAVPALGMGETAREPGGAARLACRIGWWSEHGTGAGPPAATAWSDLPVLDSVPGDPPGWRELWTAAVRDPWLWAGIARARVPLLAVGGLRDPFAAHVHELAAHWGGPARLLLGPWGHELDALAPGGALAGRRIGAVYAAWAAAALAGRLAARDALIAVDERGSWRRTQLDAPGRRVRLDPGPAAWFDVDPLRPVRSRPPGTTRPAGDAHADRVLLRTRPLPAGELCGPIRIRLCGATGAPDADWMVRIGREDPSGDLSTDLVTAVRRHRGPGPHDVTLQTAPVGAVLGAGDRLVVEVAGHHWPAHARNPHTGEDPVHTTELRPDRRRLLALELELPHRPPGRGAVPARLLPEEISR